MFNRTPRGGAAWVALFIALVVVVPTSAYGQAINLDDLRRSPEVTVEDLTSAIKPLDNTALTELADHWKSLVTQAGDAVAIAEIGARRTGAAADLTALNATLANRAERLQAIVDALEARGVDVAAYQSFLAVSGGGAGVDLTSLDVDNAGALYERAEAYVMENWVGWATNAVSFIVVLIVFRILSAIAGGIVGRALSGRKQVSDLLRSFFVKTASKLVFFVGLVIALGMVGIEIGPFLAAIGVAGFVIGFALQETLSNFAAGMMILLYRPYDIGQVVTAGGVTGKVDSMSLVSTTLLTPDNQTVVVPNGSIWGGVITNITGNDTRRVDMVFGIGYSDSMDKAEKILADIVSKHDLVLKDPAPVIQVNELADSSVNFVVRPWAKTSDYWGVYWDVTRQVKERFDAEGISIPFPQQDVHMHQVND